MSDVSSLPSGAHADLDTLALLDEGLLPEPEAGRWRAHLDACPRCRADEALLAGVRHDLAALPAPPLPEQVARTWDEALAAEREAASSAPVADLQQAAARRADRRRGRWSSPARLSAVAAAFGLVVGGGVLITSVTSSRSGTSTVAGAPATASAAASHPGSVPSPLPLSSRGVPTAVALTPVATGTTYSPDTLGTAAGRVATGGAALPAVTSSPSATVPEALRADLADPAQLAGCVQAAVAAAGGGTPVAVDLARYEGQPSVVVLVRTGPGAAAVAMPADCPAAATPLAVLRTGG